MNGDNRHCVGHVAGRIFPQRVDTIGHVLQVRDSRAHPLPLSNEQFVR
jgi:hypothetical protein